MILYRYEAEDHEMDVELRLYEYEVIKETPCGYWVPRWSGYGHGIQDLPLNCCRWVSKTAMKRFCYPTKAEAYVSFRKRKARYLQHCERRLKLAQLSVQLSKASPVIARPSSFQLIN